MVYLYMEHVKGGDLMGMLNKLKKLEVEYAQFYISQIIVCFEYLHGKDLIYRDLKPENILIDETGYIKLADFGFIKRLKKEERTYTFCGTPEYIAPEIILNKGYSFPVDYYALGIFVYELLYGRPPFMAANPYEIFQKVLNDKLLFPRDFDKDAKSLIKKLCDHDLSKRLGNLKKGVQDIKDHKFFKDFDWSDVINKRLQAVYLPPKLEDSAEEESAVPLKQIEEYNDNAKFPPIKDVKDPFIEWF